MNCSIHMAHKDELVSTEISKNVYSVLIIRFVFKNTCVPLLFFFT